MLKESRTSKLSSRIVSYLIISRQHPPDHCSLLSAYYLREVQIRYKKKRVKAGPAIEKPIRGARQIVELFSELQNEAKEKLITVSLDAKLRILCFEVVAVGSLTSIYFRPIEMIRAAIPLNPYGIIIVHNHPSGDPTPSKEDQAMTIRLMMHTEALGVDLYDHIIIGDGKYYSFAEEGLLKKLSRAVPRLDEKKL